MEKYIKTIEYSILKPTAPNSNYYYIRINSDLPKWTNWSIGYKSDVSGVALIGGPLTDDLKDELEKEYQENTSEVDIIGIDNVSQFDKILSDSIVKLPKINRLEIIDNQGRQFIDRHSLVKLSMQDNFKTLKIFLSKTTK